MRDIVTKETGTFFTGLSALPAQTATQNSSGVDLANYNGATIYILAGTWTDGTHTFHVQESNDNGNTDAWADVAATDLVLWQATSSLVFTPVKANDANSLPTGNLQPAAISSAATAINQRVGYIGNKRWIRMRTVVSGATTVALYDIIIQAGEARNLPPNV